MSVLRPGYDDGYNFWCPACVRIHRIRADRAFDGQWSAPSFEKPIRTAWRDFTDAGRAAYTTWMGAGTSDLSPYCETRAEVCVVLIRAGWLEYLPESTHEFAGKTLPMEPIP